MQAGTLALAAVVLASATGPMAAPPAPEARILAGESASAVLGAWCAQHQLPPLRSRRAPAAGDQAPAEVLSSLSARPGERVAYRRVTLACGGRTMSRADNWYLADRLTPAMNRRLRATDEPFGFVVRHLSFARRTLSSRRLPSGALEVRAVLVSGAGVTFSYVIEDYSRTLR